MLILLAQFFYVIKSSNQQEDTHEVLRNDPDPKYLQIVAVPGTLKSLRPTFPHDAHKIDRVIPAEVEEDLLDLNEPFVMKKYPLRNTNLSKWKFSNPKTNIEVGEIDSESEFFGELQNLRQSIFQNLPKRASSDHPYEKKKLLQSAQVWLKKWLNDGKKLGFEVDFAHCESEKFFAVVIRDTLEKAGGFAPQLSKMAPGYDERLEEPYNDFHRDPVAVYPDLIDGKNFKKHLNIWVPLKWIPVKDSILAFFDEKQKDIKYWADIKFPYAYVFDGHTQMHSSLTFGEGYIRRSVDIRCNVYGSNFRM